jgi:hypothetical protein
MAFHVDVDPPPTFSAQLKDQQGGFTSESHGRHPTHSAVDFALVRGRNPKKVLDSIQWRFSGEVDSVVVEMTARRWMRCPLPRQVEHAVP